MKSTVLLLALASAFTFAADNAVIAPQSTASRKPQAASYGAEAITVPQMLSYQGKLTDTLGVPVADTVYAVRFRLYAQPTGGTQFWEEDQPVRTQEGLFSVLLGSVTPIGSVPDAGALYLGMAVAGGGELTPRLRIASAAYAYLSARAANADLLQGKDTTTFSPSTHNHDVAYVNEGQASSVTSNMIVDGTIAAADLGQMGAGSGQVMKWTGSAWAPRNDSLGGGTGDNAWVRGTPDSVLFTIRQLGIARGGSNNMLYGTFRQSHVNLGVACTTGLSSQNRSYVTVGGGANNVATGDASTIAGGWDNVASGYRSAIGGGDGNDANGERATISGGSGNAVSGDRSAIGGGWYNTASGGYAVVAGGQNDTASGNWSTVGGGDGNDANGERATIGGGTGNTVSGDRSTIGGGSSNRASGGSAVVAGGSGNSASGTYAAIAGGQNDTASGAWSTVGGGYSNDATGNYATVGGGNSNYATGSYATVGGGYFNDATGLYATVGGGYSNAADTNYATVGGGNNNDATGSYATVPGGRSCAARGHSSLAAGCYARADGAGSFVWSDSCTAADSVRTTTDNRWVARARGGVYFYTNLGMTTGSYLSAGGSSWNSVSDSMTKENFRAVNKQALLEALARMRVRDYNLKSQEPSIRHIGPVAQDFHNSFGFGESNTAINMEDADGVLLAAVQALYDEVKADKARIAQLEAELAQIKK